MKWFGNVITSLRFWAIAQIALLVVLFVIGLLRGGNGLFFLSRPIETAIEILFTILGIASGIIFFFKDSTVGLFGPRGNALLYIIYLPFLYYIIFFSSVGYIVRKKKYYKVIAFVLIILMLLSFSGCARVIQTGVTYE